MTDLDRLIRDRQRRTDRTTILLIMGFVLVIIGVAMVL